MIETEGESLMTQEEKNPTYGENIICLKMASPKKSMMFTTMVSEISQTRSQTQSWLEMTSNCQTAIAWGFSTKPDQQIVGPIIRPSSHWSMLGSTEFGQIQVDLDVQSYDKSLSRIEWILADLNLYSLSDSKPTYES